MPSSRRDLFLVDPNEFVARRNELVRELRAQGDKEGAADIKSRRRPTVAVWALNQLAGERNELVQQLATTAETARAAQQALLEGDDADDFRTALARRREAMSVVSDAAGEVVQRSGRSRDTYTREIEDALNVVVGSPDLSAALARAELGDLSTGVDDSEEMFASLTPAAGAPPGLVRTRGQRKSPEKRSNESGPKGTTPKPRFPSARLVKAREQLEEQRGELSDAEAEVNAADLAVAIAEKALTEAKRELDRTSRQRDRARERHDRLRARVEQSEQLVQRLES